MRDPLRIISSVDWLRAPNLMRDLIRNAPTWSNLLNGVLLPNLMCDLKGNASDLISTESNAWSNEWHVRPNLYLIYKWCVYIIHSSGWFMWFILTVSCHGAVGHSIRMRNNCTCACVVSSSVVCVCGVCARARESAGAYFCLNINLILSSACLYCMCK